MREIINNELKTAAAERDPARLSMLRLINTAIADKDNAARAAGQSEGVSDETIRGVIDTMIRQREKSALNYEEHGRLDLASKEREEIAVLTDLLPRQLSLEEIDHAVERAVKSTGATGIRHKGRVMHDLKSRYPGRMDFRSAACRVETLLKRLSELVPKVD